MVSHELALSRETREQYPYRSFYAAILFQSFRDAVAGAANADRSPQSQNANIRDRTRREPPADRALPSKETAKQLGE